MVDAIADRWIRWTRRRWRSDSDFDGVGFPVVRGRGECQAVFVADELRDFGVNRW